MSEYLNDPDNPDKEERTSFDYSIEDSTLTIDVWNDTVDGGETTEVQVNLNDILSDADWDTVIFPAVDKYLQEVY